MEKGPKLRIILFLLHIIACDLSLCGNRVMVLLPIVSTFPQAAALLMESESSMVVPHHQWVQVLVPEEEL
jgi:hypothetical protein